MIKSKYANYVKIKIYFKNAITFNAKNNYLNITSYSPTAAEGIFKFKTYIFV